MLPFEECKKVLNKINGNYTDEEVKLIMNFIDHWAKINAKVILNKLNTISNENSGDYGPGKQR
jgi:hypothetical protein